MDMLELTAGDKDTLKNVVEEDRNDIQRGFRKDSKLACMERR